MATQGLLTVTKNDEVQLKIVVGSQGMSLPYMKSYLIENYPDGKDFDLQDIYDKACDIFGKDSTVLQHKEDEMFYFDEIIPAESFYKDKWLNKEFNPRWEHGTADFIDELNLSEEYSIKNQAESTLVKRAIEPIHFFLMKNNSVMIVSNDQFAILKEDDKAYKNLTDKIHNEHPYLMEDFKRHVLLSHDLQVGQFRELFARYITDVPMRPLKEPIGEPSDMPLNNSNVLSHIGTVTNNQNLIASSISSDENWDNKIKQEIAKIKEKENNAELAAI